LWTLSTIHALQYDLVFACSVMVAGCGLKSMFRDPNAGVDLAFVRGQWWLGEPRQARLIALRDNWVCLPWVVYLSWRGNAEQAAGELWVFADSLEREKMRRLRVLLRRNGAVGGR